MPNDPAIVAAPPASPALPPESAWPVLEPLLARMRRRVLRNRFWRYSRAYWLWLSRAILVVGGGLAATILGTRSGDLFWRLAPIALVLVLLFLLFGIASGLWRAMRRTPGITGLAHRLDRTWSMRGTLLVVIETKRPTTPTLQRIHESVRTALHDRGVRDLPRPAAGWYPALGTGFAMIVAAVFLAIALQLARDPQPLFNLAGLPTPSVSSPEDAAEPEDDADAPVPTAPAMESPGEDASTGDDDADDPQEDESDPEDEEPSETEGTQGEDDSAATEEGEDGDEGEEGSTGDSDAQPAPAETEPEESDDADNGEDEPRPPDDIQPPQESPAEPSPPEPQGTPAGGSEEDQPLPPPLEDEPPPFALDPVWVTPEAGDGETTEEEAPTYRVTNDPAAPDAQEVPLDQVLAEVLAQMQRLEQRGTLDPAERDLAAAYLAALQRAAEVEGE